MVTLTASPTTIRTLPTREEWRAMLRDWRVAITLIVAATVILLAFIAAVVFLAWQGRSTEALTAAIVAPVVGALVALLRRLGSLDAKVDAVASKVDGS